MTAGSSARELAESLAAALLSNKLQNYKDIESDQIIHGVIIVSILKTLLLTLKKNKCLTRI